MNSKIDAPEEPVIARDAAYYRAPAGLRERVRASLAAEAGPQRESLRWRPLALAASFALVALVSWNSALWYAGTGSQDALANEAVAIHVRSLMPGSHLTEVTSTDQHTVKPWFIGKIDIAPPVGDFPSAGFALEGGRLDYLAGRPAAALVYRHRAHVVTVFIAASTGGADSSPTIATRKGYAVARWKHAGLDYEAVGDISTADMTALVELVRKLA